MNILIYSDVKYPYADLIKELKLIHNTFRLTASSKTDLLNIPDNQLICLLSILKNEPSIKAPVLENKEWDYFISFLNRHFITPFIYQSLNKKPVESQPPTKILEQMRSEYLMSVSRSIKMEQVLCKLLDAANKSNVRIIVLKGQAIARTVYSNPALRSSADIDLLVYPENMAKIREILEKMGYTCLDKQFDRHWGGYNEEVFFGKNNLNIPVETHWMLYPFYQLNRFIDVETLFQHSIKIESKYLTFETLDYIDSLIFTAMHMIYKHNGDIQLNWIIDISLLGKKLSSPDDWVELQRRCTSQRALLAVENALLMAQLWTDFKIPVGFEDFSKWPEPSKEEKRNFQYAINQDTIGLFKLIFPDNAGLSEKMRILYRLIFPAPALMGMNETSKWWFLPVQYIKRWLRLIKNV